MLSLLFYKNDAATATADAATGAHPAPCIMEQVVFGSKAAGKWSTPTEGRGKECVELYLSSAYIPSWLRNRKTLLVDDDVRRAQNMDQVTAGYVTVGKFLNS